METQITQASEQPRKLTILAEWAAILTPVVALGYWSWERAPRAQGLLAVLSAHWHSILVSAVALIVYGLAVRWVSVRSYRRALQTANALEVDQRVSKALTERTSQLDAWEGRLNTAKAEMESHILEKNEFRQLSDQTTDLIRYGREVGRSAPLTEAESVAVRSRLQELRPLVGDLFAEAERVWVPIRADAYAKGEASPLHWLSLYISEHEYAYAQAAAMRFSKDVLNRDARAILGTAWINYREWRGWIVRLAQLQGHTLTDGLDYPSWRRAETAFFEELRKKLAIRELRATREEIEVYDARFGAYKPLPPETI